MTITHRSGADLIEYRRTDDTNVFSLESRMLHDDGSPFDDRWYPVSDWELTQLQTLGTGVVEALADA